MFFEKHTQANYPPRLLVETWLVLINESSAELNDARLRSKKLVITIFGNTENAEKYVEHCKENEINQSTAA